MQKVDFSSVQNLFDTKAIEIFNKEGRTKSYGVEGLAVGDTFKLVAKDGKLVEGAEFNEMSICALIVRATEQTFPLLPCLEQANHASISRKKMNLNWRTVIHLKKC